MPAMTPSEIKSVLSEMGGFANKRLGQHFLIDDSVLKTIVEAAQIKKGERVLEVGPGLGVLTGALIEQGADVMAIEQDRRFVKYLSDNSSRPPLRLRGGVQQDGGVMLVHGDAAKTDWDALVGDQPWKFVSNLPYSITSLALRKALWSESVPEKIAVLVQREVAERAIAKDGKTSLLSLMVALASHEGRIVKRVPAGCFYPAPKVESAILEIAPMTKADRIKKWGMDPEKIMALAKKGFAHPRKLLASNLGINQTVLTGLTLNPKARAEDLSPDDWAKLTLTLSS